MRQGQRPTEVFWLLTHIIHDRCSSSRVAEKPGERGKGEGPRHIIRAVRLGSREFEKIERSIEIEREVGSDSRRLSSSSSAHTERSTETPNLLGFISADNLFGVLFFFLKPRSAFLLVD